MSDIYYIPVCFVIDNDGNSHKLMSIQHDATDSPEQAEINQKEFVEYVKNLGLYRVMVPRD